MTDTTTTAIAQRDASAVGMVQKYQSDFTAVLPSHLKGATWTRLAVGVLRKDKNLNRIATQNPGSLLQALLECARLGHEPGTDSYYLVPFGNEIQGIEGYRGVVERMFRAGAVASVHAYVVCENDTFHYQPGMRIPEHTVDWFSDRGAIIGAYAYADLVTGSTSRVVVINRQYIDKVKKESRGSSSSSSPWVKWEEQMVLKTVAKRLEPWVPVSTEWRREILRAERDAATEQTETPIPGLVPAAHFPESDADEVLEGELVP